MASKPKVMINLNLDYRDFEDVVQMMSAVQCKVDCLITGNIKDYQTALLSVIQPVDFLGHFNFEHYYRTLQLRAIKPC